MELEVDYLKLLSSQISSLFNMLSETEKIKKEILDQLDKKHQLEIPQNLIEQEISTMTQNLKKEDKEKHKTNNEKLARSRIKLGLILNECGEKNNLKVTDE